MKQPKTERQLRGGAIDSSLIALARQEFMAGSSLRDLARKRRIALRTLANYSKAGEWQMQRKLQRAASTVPALLQAADARVEAVRADWSGRIGPLLDLTTDTALRVAELLNRSNLEGLDVRELATVQKLHVDSIARLTEIFAVGKADSLSPAMSEEQARAILEILNRPQKAAVDVAAEVAQAAASDAEEITPAEERRRRLSAAMRAGKRKSGEDVSSRD